MKRGLTGTLTVEQTTATYPGAKIHKNNTRTIAHAPLHRRPGSKT